MSSKVLLIFLLCVFCLPAGAFEQYPAEDFVELRSGIGEAYPVVEVVTPGEKVEVLRKRADWFLLRGEARKPGWVSAERVSKLVAARPAANLQRSRKTQGLQFTAGAGWAEKDSMSRMGVGYSFGSGGIMLDQSKTTGEFLLQNRQLLMAQWNPRIWKNFVLGGRIGVGRLIETPKFQRIDVRDREFTLTMLGGSLGFVLGRSAMLTFDSEWNAPEGRDSFMTMGLSVHGFYSL